MAITTDEVQIIVEAQVDKAINNINKVENKQEDFLKSAKNVAKVFAGSAVVGTIVKGFVDFSKAASDASSAAEESFAKFDVVFGDTSLSMQKWAEESSDALNLSESRFISMAASVGDLLKPLGFAKEDVDNLSKSMVELAFDVGSFNDQDPSKVLDDINAALTGSPETMKKYGVVINETALKIEALNSGLIEEKRQLTAVEKAQATYQLILKGTTDAQGDMLRTMDSSANVTRQYEDAVLDLKIAWGQYVNEGLTPAKSALAEYIRDQATFITKMGEMNKSLASSRDGFTEQEDSLDDLYIAQRRDIETRETQIKLYENASAAVKRSGQKFIDNLNEQISARSQLIEELERQQGEQAKINIQKEEDAKADAAIIAAQEEREALQKAFAADWKKYARSKLSDDQKEIKRLQDLINYYNKYKNQFPEAKELFEAYAAERNALQDKMNEGVEEEIKLNKDVIIGVEDEMRLRQEGFALLSQYNMSQLSEQELLIQAKRDEINEWARYIGVVPQAIDIIKQKYVELNELQRQNNQTLNESTQTSSKTLGDFLKSASETYKEFSEATGVELLDIVNTVFNTFQSVTSSMMTLNEQSAAKEIALAEEVYNKNIEFIDAQAAHRQEIIDETLGAEVTKYSELSDAESAFNDFKREKYLADLDAKIAAGDEEAKYEKDAFLAKEERLEKLAEAEEEKAEAEKKLAEDVAEAQKKATEDAEREKAKIQYDAAMQNWKLMKAQALASAAQAIVMGYAQLGPIAGSIAAVGTAVATGFQLDVIDGAKPKKNFATGGEFITNGPETILVGDNAGGQERVTIEPLSSPNVAGGSGNSGIPIYNVIQIDGKEFFDIITEGFEDNKINVFEDNIIRG
jgi:hypothetical protein